MIEFTGLGALKLSSLSALIAFGSIDILWGNVGSYLDFIRLIYLLSKTFNILQNIGQPSRF